MKALAAPLGSGIAVAALLYGLLSAAERRLPEPEDPWLEQFIADGLRAEFRSVSTQPDRHLLAIDLRAEFEGPAFGSTQIRNYQVQNTSVQLVRLPAPGLLPDLAEGRKLDVRFKPQSNPVHVCRSGRSLLFVAGFGKWVPIIGQMKTPRKDVEQIFDSFEETARRYP